MGRTFWLRGYFFRSVGSTTDEAVEFYIKITQDKQLREKSGAGFGKYGLLWRIGADRRALRGGKESGRL